MQFPDTNVIYNSPNFVINDPIYKSQHQFTLALNNRAPFLPPAFRKKVGETVETIKKLSVRPSATTL